MDSASPRSRRLPRVSLRYPHRTPTASSIHRQELESYEEEDALLRSFPDAPLLIREQRRRTVMGKDHRQFHRRAALAATTQVLTVDVEIIVTVDSAGSLLAQETVTQTASSLATALAVAESSALLEPYVLATVPSVAVSAAPSIAIASVPSIAVAAIPSIAKDIPWVLAGSVSTAFPSVPSVPAYPTGSLPSVPSVPPFPSDLTVPAYPYPSGVPVQAADVDTQPATSSSSSTDAVETATASPIPNSIPSTSIVTSSPPASSSTSTLNAIPTPLSSPQAVLIDSQNSFTQSSSSLSQTEPTPHTSDSIKASFVISSQATGTSYYGVGGNDPANTAGPSADATVTSPAGATSSASVANTGNNDTLTTQKVVGGVVGSLAGAALILMVLLFLLKRHKRNQRSHGLALTGDNNTGNVQSISQVPPTSSSLVPAAFLHRFSSVSRSTIETNATGERSFQRVSGRKLPSAFSEGMTSGQFVREGGSLSGTSLYQDDQSIYGGLGLSKEFGPRSSKEYGPGYSNEFDKEIGGPAISRASSKMNIRPSPARTPVIHHANDENPFESNNYRSTLSPPLSPNSDFPKRKTLGRSLASADGSRSSRFTENV